MKDLVDEVVDILKDAENIEFDHALCKAQTMQLRKNWLEPDDFGRQVMNGPITEGRDHWNPDAPYYSPSLSFERAIPPVPTNGYLLHSPQADQNPSLEAAPQLQLPRRLVGKLNISQFKHRPHSPKHDRRNDNLSLSKLEPMPHSLEPAYKLHAGKQELDMPGMGTKNARFFLSQGRNIQGLDCLPLGITFSHAPATFRGISLIPVNTLPDRFRGIFPFPLFNAVQSKCFHSVYESNDNIVLSSPTGSGKTAILELAICALANELTQGNYKVIYQAPTKALCAERKRDWERKFATLGLACTELTGDTQQAQLKNVKNGDIIITTPEKWDSMTRRWEDHKKLLELVRLFLIDEVHILKEARGATLEVVVSRFVALSATIPNSPDVATWLGKSSRALNVPACDERFGEEFRPVKLQRFVYGYPSTGNDFMFDKTLDKMLPGIIQKHSARKPIMIFCMTRAMCVSTAKMLAGSWKQHNGGEKYWPPPNKKFSFKDKDLQIVGTCGVAFHHAGLDSGDRVLIERLFLEGCLHVVCCTSTLAVGVNLPTYLVIIKNTVTWADGQTKEYIDLEVMQMLGRAGRPQFDDTAVAVIMTKKDNKLRYEKMVSGTETLESCLHENLVEHMNAEIGLGTIKDVESAKLWLRSTFLYVRLKRNPAHYKLDNSSGSRDVDQNLEEICEKNINLLGQAGLVLSYESQLKCSELGHAMARYYIKFKTMQTILGLGGKATMSEVLLTLSQAEEFKDMRFRVGEKGLYKELNKTIKYPVKVELSNASHKTFILMQFEIGMMEFPALECFQRYKTTLMQDRNLVFKHCHRIIRCIIDCQLHLRDSISVKSALEIARCLKAKAWENSPLQLRQIEGFGPASIKKLVTAGVRSLRMLEQLEAHKIEAIMSRNPPFGSKAIKSVRDIPRLRVTSRQISKNGNRKDPVKLYVRSEIGYLNDRLPGKFRGITLFANFLAERSDGLLIEFRRIPVSKLEGGKDVHFTVELDTLEQTIICHLVCEDIVGTLQTHELKPDVESFLYPPPPRLLPPVITEKQLAPRFITQEFERQFSSVAPEEAAARVPLTPKVSILTEPSCQSLVNEALPPHKCENLSFLYMDDPDDITYPRHTLGMKPTPKNSSLNTGYTQSTTTDEELAASEVMEQLPNGNWKCRHKCGDKTKCKHFCCREGLEKLPRLLKGKGSTQQAIPTGPRFPQTATMLHNQAPAQSSEIAAKFSHPKIWPKPTTSTHAKFSDLPAKEGKPYMQNDEISNLARLDPREITLGFEPLLRKPLNVHPSKGALDLLSIELSGSEWSDYEKGVDSLTAGAFVDIPTTKETPGTHCQSPLGGAKESNIVLPLATPKLHPRTFSRIGKKNLHFENNTLREEEWPAKDRLTILSERNKIRVDETPHDVYMLSGPPISGNIQSETASSGDFFMGESPSRISPSRRQSRPGKADPNLLVGLEMRNKRKNPFGSRPSSSRELNFTETDIRILHDGKLSDVSDTTFNHKMKIEDECEGKTQLIASTQSLRPEVPIYVLDFLGGCVMYSRDGLQK